MSESTAQLHSGDLRLASSASPHNASADLDQAAAQLDEAVAVALPQVRSLEVKSGQPATCVHQVAKPAQ